MIKFKQFRASLNEDDGTAQTVNNNNQQTQMARAFSAIDSEIDKWVFDLKKTSVKLSNHFEWLSKISGIFEEFIEL